MKPKLFVCYAAAVLLLIIGIAGTAVVFGKSDLNTVQVVRDGTVLYTFDLSAEQDRTIRLDYGGSYNIIEIKDGKIRVKEAGCKDNTCVKMGWLSSSAPVVCLPNHLVIEFSRGQDGIDAVAE